MATNARSARNSAFSPALSNSSSAPSANLPLFGTAILIISLFSLTRVAIRPADHQKQKKYGPSDFGTGRGAQSIAMTPKPQARTPTSTRPVRDR